MAQFVGVSPLVRAPTGLLVQSLPSQGTYRRRRIDVSLSHRSMPLCLSRGTRTEGRGGPSVKGPRGPAQLALQGGPAHKQGRRGLGEREAGACHTGSSESQDVGGGWAPGPASELQ